MSLKVKGKMLIKTMYSDTSVASDGAGHTGRGDPNSSTEAADTTRIRPVLVRYQFWSCLF